VFFETRLTTDHIRRYVAAGHWGQAVLHDALVAQAARTPDKAAVIDRAGTLTYADLLAQADRVALGLLELGVRPRDVVAVQLPNWREFVVAFLAIERIGAVVNPITTILRQREVREIVALGQPTAIIVPDTFRSFDHAAMALELQADAPWLRQVIVVGSAPLGAVPWERLAAEPWEERVDRRVLTYLRPDANDIGELAFTSGTTGQPKGVMHTHNTLLLAVGSTLRRQEIGPACVSLVFLPVGHNAGYFYGVRLALQAGGTVVLQDTWDAAEALRLIERHRVTHTEGTTTFIIDLLAQPDLERHDLSSLRLVMCGGAQIPPALAAEAQRRLAGFFCPVFGMTEQGQTISAHPSMPAEKVRTTVGTPQPEVEVRIVDADGRPLPPGAEGRMLIRCPMNFAGYVQGRAFTAPYFDTEDFFDTGDLARMDEQGYITITGRAKDIIIRGGENIPVKEVEDLLAAHPCVLEAVVVGIPDPRLGERACACVRLRPGTTFTLDDLRQHFAAHRVTKQFWPEALEIVADFPRTPSGKVQKFKLRAALADRYGGSAG
jgi:cyclohexanecarboxylate-CoA ligase